MFAPISSVTSTKSTAITADPVLDALAWVPTGLLIDGRWVGGTTGRSLQVEDPGTGETLISVADADPADCLAALDAAVAAQAAWAATAPRDRARILRRAADGVRDRAETLALLVSLEMGKPLAESRGEVEFAAEYLDWYADQATHIEGRVVTAPDGMTRHLVHRTPVGPCLVITPWNFPLAVPARGIAPALAAGCTVVLRPSAMTPLSALGLARILTEAGVPAGVVNVVPTTVDDATDPLLDDARLRKLTFTGSEAVGRHLLRASADQVVRVSVELGGCAPFVVFADADLDAAVEGALAAKMRNGAQACTAANRFYVERPVAAEFTRRLAARIASLRLGHGLDPHAQLGPMISRRHRDRLTGLVDDAVARGARVVVDGGAVDGDGHFFAPVVLDQVPDDARVMCEEVFGPVVPIRVFDTEAEAITLANASNQGLAAYLFTTDIARAMRVSGAIEAGMVAINRGRVSCVSAPFGGVKQSGFGASGGSEGLDEYLVTRYLTIPETTIPATGAGEVVAFPGMR